MSSADSRPPEKPSTASGSETDASAAADSNRPALKQPPRRPVRPAPVEEPEQIPVEQAAKKPIEIVQHIPEKSVAEAAPVESVESPETKVDTEPVAEEPEVPQPRVQPIAPPSEPMQYRAIGLLKGRYAPSEETFNRGHIINHDETTLPAVLLGRTTSLVKKHIDLEKEHLWVVYPRTISQDDAGIAVQIVGVWEPETLGEEEEESPQAPDDAVQPDYFSIRGEVVKYDERREIITVGIVQKMRSGKQPKRPFKLLIKGSIGVKTIGYFWDMHVRREGSQFVLIEGSYVGAVPPKKKSKKRPIGGGGGGGKRRLPSKRPGSRPKPNLAKEHGAREEKPDVVAVADSDSATTQETPAPTED